MERIVHVSTHIEKTAGTSLQEFYIRYYGPKNVYIYSSDTNSLICANQPLMKARVNIVADKLRLLSKQIGLTHLAHSFVIGHLTGMQRNNDSSNVIPNNCSLIHGHFVADKFDRFIRNPFRSVVLRDPLDRMVSHYKYWREAKGVTNHRVGIPFDPKMSFIDFSDSKCLQNFQSSALGNVSISSFDLVGVTQNLPDFVSRFIENCPIRGRKSTPELKWLNTSPSRVDYSQFGIDKNFMRKFQSQNELDYRNYNIALEMNNMSTRAN